MRLGRYFFPWKPVIETQLKRIISNQGWGDVTLSVLSADWHEIEIGELSFGSDPAITLENIRAEYSITDLWHGRIEQLNMRGLSLEIMQKDGAWQISGLKIPDQSRPSQFAIPTTADYFNKFGAFGIKDSNISVKADEWNIHMPLNADLKISDVPNLVYTADLIALVWQNYGANVMDAKLDAALDTANNQWNGNWNIREIALTKAPYNIPPLGASGTIAAQADNITVTGKIFSKDQLYESRFRIKYPIDSKKTPELIIAYAQFPFAGGKLFAKDISVPIGEKRDMKANLELQNISLGDLLGAAAGQKIAATGSVSGSVPIIFGKNGQIRIAKGRLQAGETGTISVDPSLIPGDNAQIEIVRAILQKLEYSHLAIDVDNDAQNKAILRLTIEAKNNDVYNGRPVKLNLNLTGDVLDLIKTSIMPLSNPEHFLQQDIHAP